jgi:glycosyltransferase involved in cell wall biosynthesis
LKVLIISDTIEFSGAEEAIVNLATILSDRRDVQVRLCSTRFSGSRLPGLSFEDSLELPGELPPTPEGLYRALLSPPALVRSILHCLDVASKFQPDIVHSGIFLSILPSMIISRKMRIPLVAHIHDYRTLNLTDSLFLDGKVFEPAFGRELRSYLDVAGPGQTLLALGLRRLIRSLYDRCDLLIAVSNFVKNSLSDFLKPPIRVVHNATPNVGIAGHYRGKNDRPSVLYSGKLVHRKGFHLFLEAARLLLEEMSVEIHMTGNGVLEKSARSFAQDNSSSAYFHGYLPNEQLNKLIASSHVTVHPSLSPDPCPMSVIKSVALGTTALGSRRGGLTELLPFPYLFEPTAEYVCKWLLRFFRNEEAFPPRLALDLTPATVSSRMAEAYGQLLK